MNEIKKLLGNEKLLIGQDRVLKKLREGEVKKVYLASNCSKEMIAEITHLSNLSETDVESVNVTNDELGAYCKKPFSIAVIGILK